MGCLRLPHFTARSPDLRVTHRVECLTSGKSTGKARSDSLYVYVSNESPTVSDVYFDDLKITHHRAPSWKYVLKDHLGSNRVTVNNAGHVEAYTDYLTLGGTMRSSSSQLTRYRYTGQEYDETTALHNYRARLYDDKVGRFYGIDPQGQFVSPYTGIGNNPVNFVDPDGEFITWSVGKGGFSIGFNLTPIGIPVGAGVNVGWGNGFSLGSYGELGYRVGGTGLGAGSTVQQSVDYNFKHDNLSTTTSAGAYASFGPFTAGANASKSYDISNDQWGSTQWGVNAGLGIGDERSGVGFTVSYGSGGWSYGLGGFHQSERGYIKSAVVRVGRAIKKMGTDGMWAYQDPCWTCPPGVSISDLDPSVQLLIESGEAEYPVFDDGC